MSEKVLEQTSGFFMIAGKEFFGVKGIFAQCRLGGEMSDHSTTVVPRIDEVNQVDKLSRDKLITARLNICMLGTTWHTPAHSLFCIPVLMREGRRFRCA